VESMLSDFMCESGDYMECSHEIKEKAERFNELNRQLSAYREKLEEFVKDKDIQKLTSRIDDGGATQKLEAEREALDLKRLSIVREITELETRISQNEEAAENLSLYEGEAAQLEERRAHLLNELDALKKAMAFLNEANDNLANRYLMPLLERTRDLLRLYDEGKSQLRIEANSRIMISEGGIDRELDYYSRGIKEIVSICMRIALIEVIYREASYKPFIILDDPFVNLDDQKLLSAKAFIKSLSKKYQIVYLTCHTSRII